MKLRSRLSYYSLVTFGVLFVFTSVVIYTLFYRWAQQSEYKNLQNTTLVAAVYYLEKDEQTLAEHQSVQRELTRLISRSNVAVYDSLDRQAFGLMERDEYIDANVLKQTRRENHQFFESAEHFYVSIFYRDNQGDFVVITKTSKESFKQQMNVLLWILLIVFLVSLAVIFIFSRWLGRIAYQPILEIIDAVNARDHNNLTVPISIGKSYEEVDDLIRTYNHFIQRIAQMFTVQKNFIDYVSHELRTPIAALLGTLDVTGQRMRTEKEYHEVMLQLRAYTRDLQETLDQMMLLSGAKTNFEFKSNRIDEIIWHVVEDATLYHQARIDVQLEVVDRSLLSVDSNDKLLELAIANLVENAIKYSDNKPVKIVLRQDRQGLVLRIDDQGIGIPEDELSKVTQNFFRASNSITYQGKGIGLSMANIIFSLHAIRMQIQSDQDGTSVFLYF